jgi:signal transduction histidine kinase
MDLRRWSDRKPCLELDDGSGDRADWALRQIRFGRPVVLGDEDGSGAWAFLAEVSRVLDTTRDYEATIEAIGCLAVPVLADYAVLDLAEGKEPWASRTVRGRPGAVEQKSLDELRGRRVAAFPPGGVLAAVADGRPVALPWPSDSELADLVGAEDAAIHRRLGLQSCVALPLGTDRRRLGALLLASTRPGLGYGQQGVAVAEDFAVRVALALASAGSHREAARADRRKDELLALVAHELRTPLGCVVTSLEALARSGGVARRASELQQTILRQARHLSRLVEDLLDATWVRTGTLALHPERLDLREVVRDCVNGLGAGERLGRHVVSLACAPEPVIVDGDRLRLEQVVANLLDNAAKYTPPTGAIRLGVETDDQDAVVHVQDTGIGIAPEFLPRVFEPFVRAETNGAAGGLGLGLALVRRIVEQHGGTVTIHSPGQGRGTLVVVRLPRIAAADP